MGRGHALRTRRRIPGAAGVLAVIAGVALAVMALLSPARPASHQPAAKLAAWTVVQGGRRLGLYHHPRVPQCGRAATQAPCGWRTGQRHFLSTKLRDGLPFSRLSTSRTIRAIPSAAGRASC